eukprot:gene6031-6732_t
MADKSMCCRDVKKQLKAEHNVEILRSKNRIEYQKLNNERRFLHLFHKRTRLDFSNAPNDLIGLTLEDVRDLSKKISKKTDELENQLKTLIKAFSMEETHVDAFLSDDVGLRTIVGYLSGKDSKLQIYAAYCITNLTAFADNRGYFVAKSCSPYLIALLQSHNNLMQDLCACAIGNIAAFSLENTDLLLNQGVLGHLVDLFKMNCPAVLESCAYALIKICANNDEAKDKLFSIGLLPLLLKAMRNEQLNSVVVGELAWLLTILASNEARTAKLLKSSATVENVYKYLNTFSDSIPENVYAITPLVRILGNLLSIGVSSNFERLKTEVFFETMTKYINCKIGHIVRETLWLLSNILVLGYDFNLMAINSPLTLILITHLKREKNVKIEVLRCLCTMAYFSETFADKIIEAGVFPAILKDPSNLEEQNILISILQLLEILLRRTRAAGAIKFLEENRAPLFDILSNNKNEHVRTISDDITKEYHRP